jgi:hypothetical protein
MVELSFSDLLVKVQLYEKKYYFFACVGGPLYGPAVYSKIRQIRETGSVLHR